jgi:hypothetical protein
MEMWKVSASSEVDMVGDRRRVREVKELGLMLGSVLVVEGERLTVLLSKRETRRATAIVVVLWWIVRVGRKGM